jgi:hypothetical protein
VWAGVGDAPTSGLWRFGRLGASGGCRGYSPCLHATRPMARYEHLPVYRSALAMAVQLERVVAGFSRYHKYTLGTELRNTSREIVGLVIRANSARDRLPRLEVMRDRLEDLLLQLRIGKEVRAFQGLSSYLHVVELVGSVFRQTEGWIKYEREKSNVSRSERKH